jgi:hypothetical protein
MRFVKYLPKVLKIVKQNFEPSDLFIIGHNFLGHTLYSIRVQNFLFTIWTSRVSKDAEFYIDFKNINLP